MSKKTGALVAQEAKSVTAENNDDFFEGYAGQGSEDVGPDDITIPRLAILQAQSPKLREITGAKPGDIVDVATSEIFEPPVRFMVVKFEVKWLEWGPRGSNKMVPHDKEWVDRNCQQNEQGYFVAPSGDLVARTAHFYGLNLSAMARRSFIPMASTAFRKAKDWNAALLGERRRGPNNQLSMPPFWYRVYHLSTIEQSNPKGTWFGWKIEPGPVMTELEDYNKADLKTEATAFHDAIVSGKARPDFDQMTDEENVRGSGAVEEGAEM